jgi:hypothetical protein
MSVCSDASVIWSMSSVYAPALERCGREEEEVQGLVPATTPSESTAGKLVIIGRALSPTASMRSLMLIARRPTALMRAEPRAAPIGIVVL